MTAIHRLFQLSAGVRTVRQEARLLHKPSRLAQLGWVFDIDGVLQRGTTVLPAGLGAIRELHDSDKGRWLAPVVFMTNGGGMSEAERAEVLSKKMQASVCPSQIVLSHSPLKMFAKALSRVDMCVVTVGGPRCPSVAQSYGFANVIDIAQLGQAYPKSTPFARYEHVPELAEEVREIARLPVSTVLVMSDSKDFHRDLQLIVDIVEDDKHRRPEPATIIFSNGDLTFPNEHPRPRLAGGMLRVALDAVLTAHGGANRSQYNAVQLGKPQSQNYALAEQALCAQWQRLHASPSAYNEEQSFCEIFNRVYMVGDNPKSDVRGARLRGSPWRSILVRSGNFKGENDHDDPADLVVEDAHEAVKITKNW